MKGKWKRCAPSGVAISASVTPSTTFVSLASTSPPGAEAQQPRRPLQVGLQLAGGDRDDGDAVAGSASSTSALAAAIASTEPSSSTWTGPTLVITADLGLGDRRQLGDLAGAAHRHLQDQQLGVLGASSTVSGRPISVLRFSRLAWTRPGSSARAMSLTEVLPTEPVTPTTRAPSARRQARASDCIAASGSATAKTQAPLQARPPCSES